MLKRIWQWIKHPHGWALIPLYIFTAACIACAVVFGIVYKDKIHVVTVYIIYALAAIMFGYAVYSFAVLIPKLKLKMIESLKKREFTGRLYAQFGFRTIIFAIFSLVISLGNAIVNGVIGIVYLSVWYGALGTYYLLLSAMRGGVLWYHKKKKLYEQTETDAQMRIREVKRYRACGILLILLPLALSSAILEMVVSGRAFVHSGYMIYVYALYTVYKVAMSVKNFFKARKNDDFTVQAIRNVNLADALVSILALQTAMFHEFSPERSFGSANAIVGGTVCIITVLIGIAMIVIGTRTIKKIKSEGEIVNE